MVGTLERIAIALTIVVSLSLAAPARALAHCDALDGPVVAAARKALDTRNPAPVLIWVPAASEAETRAAFEQTLAVRALSPAARDLADRYFFETVVRIHRAGEGEPYTGLKPAGQDLGPAIPAADKALADASVDSLARLLGAAVEDGVRARFTAAREASRFNPRDIEAGRRYVHAYVEFIHYVEQLHLAAGGGAHPRHTEPVR